MGHGDVLSFVKDRRAFGACHCTPKFRTIQVCPKDLPLAQMQAERAVDRLRSGNADMRRREFVTLFGAAVAWPLAARGQQAARLPIVGFLGTTTAAAWGGWVNAFVQRLRELNWSEGRNLAIELRWAEGRNERFAEIAAEFTRLKVDVIVTSGGAVLAVKQATQDIPIVFAVANDPVGSGLVASLARPEGNATGLSLQAPDLSGKRLELLREVVPNMRRLAILGNVHYAASVLEMKEVEAVAGTLGLDVVRLEIRKAADIVPVFEDLRARADAVYVVTDPLVSINRIRINVLAVGERLPTMHSVREYIEGGGLMSYGPSYSDLFRRAAEYVDKILRGAKPADLPVEQPTKFDLIINQTTAKALRIDIPPGVLARADEVIE
jgi:putative tryptophan/tyrosine transport system substrate-binding protein